MNTLYKRLKILFYKSLNFISPKRCYVVTMWYMGGDAGASEEDSIMFLTPEQYAIYNNDRSVSDICRLPHLDRFKEVKNIPPELIPYWYKNYEYTNI